MIMKKSLMIGVFVLMFVGVFEEEEKN